jgi:hypothetical protein
MDSARDQPGQYIQNRVGCLALQEIRIQNAANLDRLRR